MRFPHFIPFLLIMMMMMMIVFLTNRLDTTTCYCNALSIRRRVSTTTNSMDWWRRYSKIGKYTTTHHHHNNQKFLMINKLSKKSRSNHKYVCSPLWSQRRNLQPYSNNNNNNGENDDNNSALQRLQQQQQQQQPRPTMERPTETQTQIPYPPMIPSKPKIVVLGASGKIGRLVVRQLLEISNFDATIIAFCRDYDKAIRVLYDDLIVANSRKKGPKLQIIQGNLIPPNELPGYRQNNNNAGGIDDDDDDDDLEETAWRVRAESASKFYNKKVEDFDDRFIMNHNHGDDSNEALVEAIRGCTTIISCVGAVRPTNLWTDYLARPFIRLFKKDVSRWCKDDRHPFYVHYRTTQKVLKLAEKEQILRNVAVASSSSPNESTTTSTTLTNTPIPRIRFIRISDLVCSQKPWYLVPLVTNIIQSMVFRYQDMAESILEASMWIDTITLRPGDLVDEIRDEETTSLQVDTRGYVGSPSRIGRDDVAALAVAAALYDFTDKNNHNNINKNNVHQLGSKKSHDPKHEVVQDLPLVVPPLHYTLACRWTSENMDPYPSQGLKQDGYQHADICIQNAFQKRKRKKFRNTLSAQKAYTNDELVIHQQQRKTPRKMKPYGICVAIPVYVIILLLFRSVVRNVLMFTTVLPGIVPITRSTPPWFQIVMQSFAYLFRRFTQLYLLLLSPLLNLTSSGRNIPKYISF